MGRSLFLAGIAFLGIAIILNRFVSTPDYDTLYDQAAFEMETDQFVKAVITLQEIWYNDSLSSKINYHLISTHFKTPHHEDDPSCAYYRDDQILHDRYLRMSEDERDTVADIGRYGLGLIAIHYEDYPLALHHYQSVKNSNLPYLNNSLGYVLMNIDSLEQAEERFRKEIAQNGNIKAAWSNLSRLYYLQGRGADLYQLLDSKDGRAYADPYLVRIFYLKGWNIPGYLGMVLKSVFAGLNLWGFLAAFLILAIWAVYLRKLDVFEPEKMMHMVLILLLGMFFSLLVHPISDFLNVVIQFDLNGGLINDFLYCVVGIGVVEEAVKIIPLLWLIKKGNVINEPYDYIYYASLSALGFAFVENLIYFDSASLDLIHGRALSAAMMHMFLSSIIAYGLIINKYRKPGNVYNAFLKYFFIAALVHGAYDFFLINPMASKISIISLLVYLIALSAWNSFTNNSLNLSSFFDELKTRNIKKINDYLVYTLSGVLLFEYAAMLFTYGSSTANGALGLSIVNGTFMILFISFRIGTIHLYKGSWVKYKIASPFEEQFRDKEHYAIAEGSSISILPLSSQSISSYYLPSNGVVLRQVSVGKAKDWYLTKLENQGYASGYLKEYVLVRLKDPYDSKINDKIVIGFYLIHDDVDVDQNSFTPDEFSFCGWAYVE
jgi:protease PrsW